jgi:predicted dienelactone hydrolase
MARLSIAAVLALGAGIAALPSSAAGLSLIEVSIADTSPMAGGVWYPCATLPGKVPIGRGLNLPGVENCPIVGEHLPLIVVSHGFGGNFAGHHDTAEALADAGFIVAAITHPADKVRDRDPSGAEAIAALTSRPEDIVHLIDFMLGPWPQAAKIDPNRIGFFGFSRGGFTGLALLGGKLDTKAAIAAACPPNAVMKACADFRASDVGAPAITLVNDPRIKAAVLADPLFGRFFDISTVQVPIQVWASVAGGDGVVHEDGAAVANDLPSHPKLYTVPNSAHFAFLPPCDPQLTQARPDICVDAAGFDRAAFHARFNEQIVAFLRAHLAPHS